MSNLLAYSCSQYFLIILCISCGISYCFSPFISNFIYLGSHSVFMMNTDKLFVNVVYLFKDPFLGFIYLLYFFSFYVIYLCSNFYFLPSTHLALFVFPLCIKLDCLHLRFFLILTVGLNCYEFPSLYCFPYVPQILGCFLFIFFCLKVTFDFFLDLFLNPLIV